MLKEVKQVFVPDIGSFSNVEIIEILVKEGETIAKDASLITLETDKATMEIPAPFGGKIKAIKLKVGDKVSAGDLILTLEVEGQAQGHDQAKEQVQAKGQSTTDTKINSDLKSNSGTKTNNVPIIQKVVVPDIGSFSSVEVIEVLVKAGDKISKDASLITLETDKATMEIPSPFSGIVKSFEVKVGDKVSAGDLILTMETEEGANQETSSQKEPSREKIIERSDAKETIKAEETASNQEKISNQEKAQAVSPAQFKKSGELPHAGPAVRRFARELGVELQRVVGTGRKGRILQIDVQQYVKGELKRLHTADAGGAGSGATGVGSFAGLNLPPWPQIDHGQFGPISKQALPRIKKLSGAYLLRNWLMVPHVTQFDEADITELEQFRKDSQALAEEGVKLTPLVFIMKAVVAALQSFPSFNASLDASGSELILKKYYHIGVAVDTPNGLMVPVVRDVDQKGIFQLAKELGEISQKARKGELKAQDMQGSSFTISSLGGVGGTAFTPIINVPDVAILGVSRSSMKPVYKEGAFIPRLMLPLSLSYDHRVIDGAEAARFSTYLVKQLSDLRRLLL